MWYKFQRNRGKNHSPVFYREGQNRYPPIEGLSYGFAFFQRKERVYWKTALDETVLLQLLQDHLWICAYQCDHMRCRCFQQQ